MFRKNCPLANIRQIIDLSYGGGEVPRKYIFDKKSF